jgi:hypothetical protein
MSRLIRSDSPARQRAALLDSIRATLPALQSATEVQLRDRLAFIVLALRQVHASVELTAEAWERRAYWVKADQFRRSWGWADAQSDALQQALQAGDLADARLRAEALQARLPPPRAAKPPDLSGLWEGCHQRLEAAG